MPLDQNDERIIRSIFRDELQPVKDDVRTLNQTVYGSDGKSGLRKAFDDQADEIESLKTFRTQIKTALATVVPAVQITIGLAVAWVQSKFR